MKIIETPNAPVPGGHYSQAIIHGGFIFVSGQLPIEPGTGRRVLGEIEDQTDQALRNLAAILEAAGSGLYQVVSVQLYISDIGLWDRANAVYARFFGGHKPARAVVPVTPLHFGFAIEIAAIAVVNPV